ncbi:Rap1a/Tai family immunity protein [Sinorhizobium fredii]|uniref:Rap1a/Tai family immunity protein n=1 Tax=Rhizobium fredii TaxID=380 RepID=UPI003513021D
MWAGKICYPSNVTTQQVRDIVCDYLANHPETRHQPAQYLSGIALAEAFPCEK